jgi:hypothetical protein
MEPPVQPESVVISRKMLAGLMLLTASAGFLFAGMVNPLSQLFYEITAEKYRALPAAPVLTPPTPLISPAPASSVPAPPPGQAGAGAGVQQPTSRPPQPPTTPPSLPSPVSKLGGTMAQLSSSPTPSAPAPVPIPEKRGTQPPTPPLTPKQATPPKGGCTAADIDLAARAKGLAFCVPVIYNIHRISVPAVLHWRRYHAAMGFTKFIVYIYAGEQALLKKSKKQHGALELHDRFLSLPDVEYVVQSNCKKGSNYNCGQVDAIKNCFSRTKAQGFRWAAFGDIDEFFVLHPPTAVGVVTTDYTQSLLERLNTEYSTWAQLTFGKHTFERAKTDCLCLTGSCKSKECQPLHKCETDPSGLLSVMARLPCRVAGAFCHKAACHPGTLSCEPRTCPQPNCGAETCPGNDGRRKPVLQLPMRTSATTAHGDTDVEPYNGTQPPSRCHHSQHHVSTNVMGMYEVQGLPFKSIIESKCVPKVECPAGFVRDTFMKEWEMQNPAPLAPGAPPPAPRSLPASTPVPKPDQAAPKPAPAPTPPTPQPPTPAAAQTRAGDSIMSRVASWSAHPHRCRFLYVDLGANIGVQPRKFFEPEVCVCVSVCVCVCVCVCV